MKSELNGVLQIALPVQNIDRATVFYRDILGLKLLMSAPNMAFFDCGGVRLYLSSGAAPTNASIYFRTPNMAEQLTSFKENNVTIHQEPQVIAKMPDHDLWLMWFRDSEGNLLGVMEERKTGQS